MKTNRGISSDVGRGWAWTKWHRGFVVGTAMAVLVTGCQRAAPEETAGANIISLGPENVVVADSTELESGPVISGTLATEHKADIRAQVAGTVIEVKVEPGEKVARGALLARIESSAISDAYASAQSSVRSAEAAQGVARRNLERAERLSQAGAIAARDVETAQYNVTSADAAVADAKSRLATAGRQLGYTEVRAPFAGVVSARPASAGDVMQVGTAMVTIVDPSSMQLEASVPAQQLSAVRVGAPVSFSVNGYAGRIFRGEVERVNPTVDPTTRQVRIYAHIPNDNQALVAGLFAEGRVAASKHTGVVVPRSAVDERGLRPVVMRLKSGKIEKVEVELGLTDAATERVEIARGVAAGDTLLLGSAQGLTPGSLARVRSAAERVDTGAAQ
ncbi:MAG: efflux RND transporter periplasmic adaptor subunit [Gemmatimonadota bacterium]